MTTKYSGTIRSLSGQVVPGATVTVYLAGTTTLATLTTNAGDAQANPVTSRVNGYYEFKVADGLYDIKISGDTFRNVLIGTLPPVAPSYTVATLPAQSAGKVAYASDGCKNGETTGNGTGVLVFSDGTNWIACDTGATVGA